jgi:signal transduction histidine kinase
MNIRAIVNKAVVVGALAAFITTIYVAIVVGIGAAIGIIGEPNLALSILATGILAVAFQPVRERVQGVANRMVYGHRASPYEVLARFSDNVAGAYATEDVLPRMARVIAQGTAAGRAEVWLRIGPELRLSASWPEGGQASRGSPAPLTDGELPQLPECDRAVPVRHRGELLGALAVSKPPGEPLTPAEDKLLSDLAAQAGLVLRNVRLSTELQARLDEISGQALELRASRQRIVAAQDAERRRLERDIHDGAQQHLVALAVKLRLARTMVAKDRRRATEILTELQGETEGALETLRDLVRGIYPPILEREGLAAALAAHARKIGLAVAIEVGSPERQPAEVEAAAYFCCLEAFQNVVKHAFASRVVVRLERRGAELLFSVSDDGVGFDPGTAPLGLGLQNMADRVEALGGSVEILSTPGEGTTLTGKIPLGDPARASAATSAVSL